ncbi:MAG: Asp-tRNA(Asn)/Glu-tRNA(Gln) amidotransferase subunit GatC [Treponema sp.]|nr:Asp-tRNA(Asn)/Glu-tRNA(Gln) amidotransferase subunit GatC [Treponema sp.]
MIDIKIYEAMAKLDPDETERQWLSAEAEKLINSFNALEKIDTAGIQPLVTVLNLNNILRDDKAKKTISREDLLSNAPEQYGGSFQVPRTLE